MCMPEPTIALSIAEAHGMGQTGIFSSIAFFTRLYAGSDTHGVPASDISATSFHSLKISMILFNLLLSL